jgi:hypothetical protein
MFKPERGNNSTLKLAIISTAEERERDRGRRRGMRHGQEGKRRKEERNEALLLREMGQRGGEKE